MKHPLFTILALAFALATTACVPWWDRHHERYDRGEHYDRR